MEIQVFLVLLEALQPYGGNPSAAAAAPPLKGEAKSVPTEKLAFNKGFLGFRSMVFRRIHVIND